ncbi:MAG TPA: AI-2E family transporter [Polyangia bacterium]|nr:AI-2E family transporter [Polyangia bacterium]
MEPPATPIVPIDPVRAQKRTFGVLFLVGAFLFLWTISPMWVPIFLGILLAVVATPLKRRLERRLGGHPRLLAAVISAVTLAIGVGTIALIGFVVVRELVEFFSGPDQQYAGEAIKWVHSKRMTGILSRFGETPDHVVTAAREKGRELLTHLSGVLGSLLTVTSNAVLTLIFTFITSYYLLLDGGRLATLVVRLLPLRQDETRSLIADFRESTVGILLSIGVVSLFQGVSAGIGFAVFGVPKPLVWGALTGAVSLIPAVGTALICVPVGVLQIATGHVWSGVGVLVYWLIVVVMVADYVLRPRVLRGRLRIPDLLVLIGVFGGLEAFGVLGLALGPLIVALFVTLVRIYERDYRPPTRPLDLPAR